MEPEQVRNIMDSMIRKLYDMELEDVYKRQELQCSLPIL